MLDAVRDILERDKRIAYALIFGSRATGRARPDSDLDVAIGVPRGVRLTALELGRMVSDLEAAVSLQVDVVIVGEATIPVRFHVFRDGQPVFVRDRDEMVRQKAQAIIDWLDFQPTHDILVAGALRAAARG